MRGHGGTAGEDEGTEAPPSTGAGHAAPAPLLAGRRLGRWRLDAPLGEGAMGAVWLATADDGARVAVKIVHPHLAPHVGGPGRFRREAELGLRVRHENVVRTLDAGEVVADGATLRFLVMEHVDGRTLRTLLDESARLPEELCRHVGREVAKGLAAIHAEGAVHRDLKPENVMVTREHVVRVMDLGVARVEGDLAHISQTGALVGSLHYAAPEQFTDAAGVDARADLYSLGVLLYELATGVHPFGGGEVGAVVRRILDETPRRAGAVDPQISPLLEELLAQLLEKDREKRPERAADVAAILAEGEASAWWRQRARAIRAATRRPLRRIRIARETGLHGRDAELALLRSLFERAAKGDGQVAVIEGEAGIGKSRLVDEFVAGLVAAGEDVDFLAGSWPPGGAATATGAFATAYREHLGEDGLEDVLRGRLGAAHALAPAFAALLCGLPAPEGSEPLTRDSLATCFVRVTRSLAAERTTIVLADDLHFAPEEGRALFSSLAHAAPGHRVLLLGTARPEVGERWAAEVARAGATRLPLARLGPKDLVGLLRDAMRSDHLAEQLGVRIADKSDGNPFFVFEILRGLREGRFIARRPDGTWVTTRDIREIDVPPSIVGVVQARVSDLDRADRDVLETAACAGFEFDAAVVGEVLGVAPIPLLQRLGAIEKRTRLVRSVGRRFVFDHHQVQEVLYAGLSEPLREAYHAGIGAAIEARSGAASREPAELGGPLCVEIAGHFLKSARAGQALRYLDPALTFLERSHLGDAAVRLADSALAAPGLLAAGRRCEVLLRKATRLNILARRKEQQESLEEASALAGDDPALRARARLVSGQFFKVTNRPDEARAALTEAISLSRQVGDRRGEADASVWLANVLRALGRHDEARSHLELALSVSREIGHRAIEANATASLGVAFSALGRWDDARAQFERHHAMSVEMGDRRGEAIASGSLGNVHDAFGRYDEARACHEHHAALCREFGDRVGEAIARGNLGNVLNALGRLDEARANLEHQLTMSREIGDRRGEALALVNLGPIWLQLGDVARARDAFTASSAICRAIGARYPEGYALHGLAQTADADGDPAGALRLHEEALVLRRSNGYDGVIADSLFEIGDLRRRAGDLPGARAAFDEAVALARDQRRPASVALGLALLARLPGGDADAAVSTLEASGPGMETPRVRFLLWEATRDPSHLAAAKRLLDHLVAHAPDEYRETMVANVGLHREIAEAARANGV